VEGNILLVHRRGPLVRGAPRWHRGIGIRHRRLMTPRSGTRAGELWPELLWPELLHRLINDRIEHGGITRLRAIMSVNAGSNASRPTWE
jgi:hypothetical protein